MAVRALGTLSTVFEVLATSNSGSITNGTNDNLTVVRHALENYSQRWNDDHPQSITSKRAQTFWVISEQYLNLVRSVRYILGINCFEPNFRKPMISKWS